MTRPFSYDLTGKKIFVAGHKGMVGSAIVRRLARENCVVLVADRSELDLAKEEPTLHWLMSKRPDVVVHAAAKVGGISANSNFPVDFLCDNLAVELNVIRASHAIGVERLLFLGSSCIYPKHARQPINEEDLLTGSLEPTNEWYAIAKIAGLKMCQAYRRQYGFDAISVMPTNLYGPEDNFSLQESHVLPALMRKFWEAKASSAADVTIWGTGSPRREFLYVDDLADACLFLMQNYSEEGLINIGWGRDVTILEPVSYTHLTLPTIYSV